MNNENPSRLRAAPPERRPSQEEISQRAHSIWEEAGSPEGSERDHWLQAERELSDSAESEERPTTPYGASGSSSMSGQSPGRS